jgi:sporulation protein YlmC with PRC-barrel domain
MEVISINKAVSAVFIKPSVYRKIPLSNIRLSPHFLRRFNHILVAGELQLRLKGCAMQRSKVWLGTTLLNDQVRNSAGENLGKIEDIVVDPVTGAIQYAVLSFGGFLGMGDKLFAIPWSSLHVSPARDYILLNIDKKTLERAPGFDRKHWPDMTDTTWQKSIHQYYGTPRTPAPERTVYVDRPVAAPPKKGLSALAAVMLTCLALGLLWVGYLVSTRGWDQARDDMTTSLQGAAYAMKETSEDAALTAKVKTAMSLSKRIPANQINVDSEGDVVTLRGEVANEEIRSAAEAIARDTVGVGEVHNHLFALSRSQ